MATAKKKKSKKSASARKTKKKAARKKASKTRGRKTGAKSRPGRKKAGKTQARRSARRKPASRPKEASSAKPKKRKVQLKASDIEQFKNTLISMRNKVAEQIDSLKGDSLRRADSVYSEEDGTDAFDRQMALDLVGSEHDALFEIDEALRHISEGTYGVCEECGKPIRKSRMKALPFARLCVKCKSASEKGPVRFHGLD
ncbi:MAG: TraR/DksA C4-type zinc finger protein [Kiritimatiellia bacterium]